jgi:hypothetical protein
VLVSLLLFILAVGIFNEINDKHTPYENLPNNFVDIDNTFGGLELIALTAT